MQPYKANLESIIPIASESYICTEEYQAKPLRHYIRRVEYLDIDILQHQALNQHKSFSMIQKIISLCLAILCLIGCNSGTGRIELEDIKTQEQLNLYVAQTAKDKCIKWHKHQSIVNETNRASELTDDDYWIYNFSSVTIPILVQNANLSNSCISTARDLYDKTLDEGGYKYQLNH